MVSRAQDTCLKVEAGVGESIQNMHLSSFKGRTLHAQLPTSKRFYSLPQSCRYSVREIMVRGCQYAVFEGGVLHALIFQGPMVASSLVFIRQIFSLLTYHSASLKEMFSKKVHWLRGRRAKSLQELHTWHGSKAQGAPTGGHVPPEMYHRGT